MRLARSVIAVGAGLLAAAAFLFVLVRVWPLVDDVLRPGWRAETAYWVEPTHALTYHLLQWALLWLLGALVGIVAAWLAPCARMRHALAAGLLVGFLGLWVQPDDLLGVTLEPAGIAAFKGGVVAVILGAAAIGGWSADRLAALPAGPQPTRLRP